MRPDQAPEAAGRWPALAVLASGVLLAMTTWFSASAVIPQLRAAWGLGTGAASLLTISVQLGFVAGALASAAGNLADRVNPRRLILLGALGAACANAGLLWAHGLALALPLRALTGAFLAGVYPPSLKAMSTWFRRGRGTALGIMVGALTLGSAAPQLVNGLGGVNWRVVIAVTSLLTVFGGLLAGLVGRDGPNPFPRAVFTPGAARRAFADRGVRLATVGYFGHMWELYAMWAWAGVFAAAALRQHGVADPNRGAAFAAFAVIGVGALGCWAGGILGDRWGRTRLTMLAMVLSGTSAVVIGFLRGGPLWLLLAVGLFWGFWVVADSAQFSTIITEVATQAYVGTALTVQLAAGFVLTVLTIYLVPVLSARYTWTWAFAVLAPGPALGAWAMLRLLRSPEAARIAGGRG